VRIKAPHPVSQATLDTYCPARSQEVRSFWSTPWYTVRGVRTIRAEKTLLRPEEAFMRCSLAVNQSPVEVDVEPRELLVDVLRDRLGLTGTKVGCDTAQCGSCVVHLDGVSVKSCQVLAVQASGSSVVTIEGIGNGGDLTDLQERLWRTHGVQCGFCTPGVVMALEELLAADPEPSEADVTTCLAGNLCRCTGYRSIVEAVVGERNANGVAAAPAGTTGAVR
jgi:carbon-monoxide dehydrogenase small subunit